MIARVLMLNSEPITQVTVGLMRNGFLKYISRYKLGNMPPEKLTSSHILHIKDTVFVLIECGYKILCSNFFAFIGESFNVNNG